MANITGWIAGRLAATWTDAFNAAELNSLAYGNSMLSAKTFDNANAANLDEIVKVSMRLTIASSALVQGANIAIWLAEADDTGAYGDGRLTAGTAAAYTPGWEPLAIFGIQPGTLTAVNQVKSNLILPQSAFSFIIQNNLAMSSSGANLAASGDTIKFLTGNINGNAS